MKEILVSDITKTEGVTKSGTAWTLFCGDAKESLKHIPDNSIDCVITSPPYYSLRDYKMDGQIGLEDTVVEYVMTISDVFDEVYRVLKDKGVFFLNIGDTYYSGKGKSCGIDAKCSKRRFGLRPVDKSGGLGLGILRKSIIGVPWRVAIEMMTRHWILRAPIIWHRPKSLPETVKDRPQKSYEYVFMFVKDRFYFFNRSALKQQNLDEDIWSITSRSKSKIDTAPFPDELVEKCLDIGCPDGGTVLDPFSGSGTTLRVAAGRKHPVVGIELNKDFCNYIKTELAEV